MSLDPYATCPCGSGKKFKWCCAPIHQEIEKAFAMEREGQHEAALKALDAVVAANPDNPEPLGRKAQLLYQLGKADEAETTLQKALELNPKYPFGHYLRGRFRHFEGEIPGALLLFRKAADLYDPTAHAILADLFGLIAECELKLNRPVAARAAFQQVIRHDPTDQNIRAGMEQLFGKESRLPEPARREYTFLPQAPTATPEQKTAWQQALSNASTGKLSDVVQAFDLLTKADSPEVAAWFNLGLSRAWLGDNPAALEALERYVALESDDAKTETAWALAEVLRCGFGMEAQADYVEHTATFQIRDPNRIGQLLGELERERRLAGAQVQQEEGVLSALILEKVTALTPELAATKPARLGSYLLLAGPILRIWNVNKELFDATLSEIRQRGVGGLGEPMTQPLPAQFIDVLSDALVFPVGLTDEKEARDKVRQHMESYFEETWIHRPLKSLSGVPPLDAAGSGALKKKLRGVVKFLQECAALSQFTYDFDRLRRKLGLLDSVPAPLTAPLAPDLTALGAMELAALKPEEQSEEQLEQAYQTALKLDARELAGRFAQALVNRPANAARPDRFPWFTQLVNFALADGKTDDALALLGQGEQHDSEVNEGKRRSDYELRRAQVHARRGDIDDAARVFDELIARVPAEPRFRGSAAESMLSAKQPGRAKAYAEQGLALARQKNDRDSEQYFLELAGAAKKHGG